MKITIYELLGMIKDGKAPKKIKYKDRIYELTKKEMTWADEIYYVKDNNHISLNFKHIKSMNNEVEIIEEDKKIEKLDYCEENTFMGKCKENSYLTREEIRLLDSNFKELGNKINELIDVFNKLNFVPVTELPKYSMDDQVDY